MWSEISAGKSLFEVYFGKPIEELDYLEDLDITLELPFNEEGIIC